MAIGDLQLPLYPWGSLAPMLPQLAKAQSNVTASNIPSAKIPGPYDFLNAMTSLSNVQGENALRQQQMGLVNTQLQAQQFALDLQRHPEKANALLDALMGKPTGDGGTISGAGGAVPGMQTGAQPQTAAATPDTVTGRDLGDGMQAGGALSPSQIAAHAEKAGFTGDAIPKITAIAMAESGGRPDAYNPKDPSGGSYGITQINGVHEGAKSALNDPQAAMDLAFKVSEGGTNFKPWSTYTNGAYKQFLGGSPDTVENASAPAQPVRMAQNGPMPSLAGNLPPQGSLPQGASAAPQMPPQMPGSLSGGFPVPTINGYSLYDLARRGTAAEFLKLPNMAKPMFEAAGLDPNIIYQKELAGALAKLGPEMFQKWNIPTPVRSNTDLVNPSDPTRPIYRNLPVGPGQAYNNATGTASPIPGYVPNRADIVGTEETAKRAAEQGVKYGDLLQPPASPAFPMGNAMPGTAPPPGAIDKAQSANLPTGYQQFEDKSIWTPRGTILPSIEKQTLPKTEEEAHPYVSDIWPKTVDSWTTAAPLAEAAEQRTSAMIDAMKDLETKPFNTAKADISSQLRSLGLSGVADDVMSAKDVSSVQFIMHNSVANSLNTLKSVNSRFSQMEFKVNTQNSVNPDITPAANREMAINDLAMVRNIKTLPQDWLDAKHFQGWRNPVDFQAARMEGNPLRQQVESIRQQVGDLKGMGQNQGTQGPQIIQHDGKSYLKHDGKYYPIQP